MEALVDFCRGGVLGPLTIGMSAVEVEGHLGLPDDITWLDGDSDWRLYRYGNLTLTLTVSRPAPIACEDLRLRRISVDTEEQLDESTPECAADLVVASRSGRVGDLVRRLRADQIEVSLRTEDVGAGELYQRFHVGPRHVAVMAYDGLVCELRVE